MLVTWPCASSPSHSVAPYAAEAFLVEEVKCVGRQTANVKHSGYSCFVERQGSLNSGLLCVSPAAGVPTFGAVASVSPSCSTPPVADFSLHHTVGGLAHGSQIFSSASRPLALFSPLGAYLVCYGRLLDA